MKLISEWHKVKATPKTTVTVICGNCEAEWDADKLPGTADCPWCGNEGSDGDHVIRIEAEPKQA